MHIALLEPYFTGSHRAWATEYARYSAHTVSILSLPGRFWKWRMHGGAVTLAKEVAALPTPPDLILATDMINLATFQALTRKETHHIPCALYFHENQLTYPWSPQDRDVTAKRDSHYGFINYVSALTADAVFFNSAYHLDSFLNALPNFLKHFPDFNEPESIETIKRKTSVLPLGLELNRFDAYQSPPNESLPPLILWNHRWEYDKNPADFFNALYTLAEQGFAFRLAVLGENFRNNPVEFAHAQSRLADRIIHFGYEKDFREYARRLQQADILPVTSNHDFFGAGVVQAIYCGCYPLLPHRMAYPRLIPESLHDKYIYRTQTELVEKLAALLSSPIPLPTDLYDTVSRFNWLHLAPQYDETLGNLAKRT